MNIRILGALLIAAALSVSGSTVPEAFGQNYGRMTAPHEQVHGDLSDGNDVDDFTFDAAPGFKLKIVVKRDKDADFAPVVELVRPDGTLQTDVKAKTSKKAGKLKAILADEGRYAIRVRAEGGAGSGGYTLKWKLKQSKVDKVKKDPVAGDQILEYPFPAVDGALVSWKLKFRGDGGAQVVRVLDPDGSDVGFDPEDGTYVTQRKLTSEKVKDFPVSGPGGLYALEVENSLFPVELDLKVKVKLPKIAKENVTLMPTEPTLDTISPQQAGCGVTCVIEGANLSEDGLAIWFGNARVEDFVVNEDGDIEVAVPAGTGTVDIVYVQSDGQVAVLLDAFTFDVQPTITSIDPTAGPGVGGTDFILRGTNFETEVPGLYRVTVGGVDAVNVQVVDSETITCRTPAHVAGPKEVRLIDDCGNVITAEQQFTYGVGRFITLVTPSASPSFGGIPVTVSGSNFENDDEVYFDGMLVTSNPIIFNDQVIGHRVDSIPAHAPGPIDIEVRSSTNQSATKEDALVYYEFEDITDSAIPAATSTDDWGGISIATVDSDSDGTIDLIIITNDTALAGTRPATRILKNDGTGVFSDVTATHMPAADLDNDWAGNTILAGRLNGDGVPDLYLGVPGEGVGWDKDGDGTDDWNEARLLAGNRYVDPWGRLLFGDSDGVYTAQTVAGATGLLSIPGLLVCNATWACAGVERGGSVCKLFDYDFRSTAAAMGDLDADLDQDVLLVNDESLADFTGLSAGTWVSCYGNQTVDYQYYEATAFGSALRILTTGSNGGLTDRTEQLLATEATATEDFRGVAAAVGDMNGDFLNDILITHNQPIGSSGVVAASRLFVQQNTGNSVQFKKQNFFPSVGGAGEDDWRGEVIVIGDFNNDLNKDVVIALNDEPPGNSTFATRLFMQNSSTKLLSDRTDDVLGGLFPAGDDGRAAAIHSRDIDKDGDFDLLISTPDAVGAGNRQTRYFINIGRDPDTTLPIFIDGAAVLPSYATDPGNAVQVVTADIDGDADLDIILTDTFDSGNSGKRTRIFRQVREAQD